MKKLITFMSAALLLPVSLAHAGETPKTVVELFTSQGCSSCPPANEFVGKLADDPDKLVLSYGVTYWDYLGWKDSFADRKFTKRQKEYGKSLDIGYVYTPQIVLNGTDHNSRYAKSSIRDNVLSENDIDLDLKVVDEELVIDTNSKNILVVTYKPGWQSIDVQRGENGGRTLEIANVVEDIKTIKNSGPTKIKTKPGLAYAALLHSEDDNRIIAASVLRP